MKSFGLYVITFDKITGTMTSEVTIKCKSFKNPIVPELIEGYAIES
jgi:hypothetical protein